MQHPELEDARSLRPGTATVAFVDLAGFSAITDVFGDAAAIGVLQLFESMVLDALRDDGEQIKWIGDEVMLAFPTPVAALTTLGRLVAACRAEPRLPLTRVGLNHGPVVRRGGDLYGATVNVASRVVSRALPGQVLATQTVADAAADLGIEVVDLGSVALRSVAAQVRLGEIRLGEAVDAAWIDPVCKMHAPFAAFRRADQTGPWFCSATCAKAYRSSPETYPPVR